ncbi:uncharacterized protein LOC133495287 isoform X2 [Syngnathoides biaculeatus]|uniref:uncharacterized protein LOC133495287 isoform X2 n=1 Tax=Syngnathoides biaculeatus TaxID=300417 RepID=UPI002ADE5A56|nr:uncharacterized protein LOC133495287 isoform X2 [Syngnathoides biaculeatus]
MFVAVESRQLSENDRRVLAMQALCRSSEPVASFLPVVVEPPQTQPQPQPPPPPPAAAAAAAAAVARQAALPASSTRRPAARWTAKPRTGPQIQNVTSSVKLGCDLDLEFIARNSWNVQHLSTVFKSLVMKIRKPQTTARIFQSGILFCTGAKSEGESRVAARKFAFKILKLGYPVRFLDFKVLNIGGTCKTFPINLEDLFLAHQDHCSYEPELFPALQYNFRPGMTASIFSSGSVSLVGAKTEDEFYRAFRSLDAILTGFRRT